MAFTATPGSWTPINMFAMLRNLINQDTPILTNAGVPTNGAAGTYFGQAGKGALIIDTNNGNLYINTNTKASPTWTLVASGVSGGFVQYSPFINTATFAEFTVSAIIAGATQTQAGATQLTGHTNSVDTNAASGNGVKLPAAAPGLDIAIINNTNNNLQVYGLGADTIDGITNTVGVTQMPNSTVFYVCGISGKWTSEGLASGYSPSTGLATSSFTSTVSAAGANQAAATALTAMMNRVSTVAVGAGVALPVATVGEYVVVDNRGANPLQVYGNNTAADTINGLTTATGVTQPVNSIVTYTCFVVGNWETSFLASGLVSWLPLAVNGAIPVASHYYAITKAGILADTLAAPAASPGGDGVDITITSDTANAHVITFTGGTLDSGAAGVTTATFPAQKGASLRVISYNARWKLVANNLVAIT